MTKKGQSISKQIASSQKSVANGPAWMKRAANTTPIQCTKCGIYTIRLINGLCRWCLYKDPWVDTEVCSSCTHLCVQHLYPYEDNGPCTLCDCEGSK